MTFAWIDLGDGRQVYRKVEAKRPKRSHLPCPMIAGDCMEAVQSMVTGQWYDSKSAIRAEYRREGVEEVGNDPARLRPKPKAKPDRNKIRESLQKAVARVNSL